jgi:hypothetical protein
MAGELARESRADKMERGRAARKAVPLASLGELHAAADQDPVTLLEQQVGRVPDLIPVRYGRMLLSPFTFYRGAAHGRRPREGATLRAHRPAVR